ncbi:MAG TPA: Uma2 family endonuclease [Verrucomicrobiae bacterium]|nr:Uma2 family endonuclease [Verrucomicrobiae bacterium]
MTASYQETIEGQIFQRSAPGRRHELICSRLHTLVGNSVARAPSACLLSARAQVQISEDLILCPDLALLASATGKLWLAVEIVDSGDHRTDTVIKKQIYEEMRLPRLWMIDPRYDNVEIYHGNEYGLALKGILAGREVLMEKLLPQFQLVIADLFAP